MLMNSLLSRMGPVNGAQLRMGGTMPGGPVPGAPMNGAMPVQTGAMPQAQAPMGGMPLRAPANGLLRYVGPGAGLPMPAPGGMLGQPMKGAMPAMSGPAPMRQAPGNLAGQLNALRTRLQF